MVPEPGTWVTHPQISKLHYSKLKLTVGWLCKFKNATYDIGFSELSSRLWWLLSVLLSSSSQNQADPRSWRKKPAPAFNKRFYKNMILKKTKPQPHHLQRPQLRQVPRKPSISGDGRSQSRLLKSTRRLPSLPGGWAVIASHKLAHLEDCRGTQRGWEKSDPREGWRGMRNI